VPVATSTAPASSAGWGIRDSRGFSALCAIGMVDNATRTGFLTFMPFMLMSKELTVGGVGLAFSLVFIGGAAGKFVCGLAADRVGVIRTVVLTEAAGKPSVRDPFTTVSTLRLFESMESGSWLSLPLF
jgi:hypothetical protein